MLRGDLPAWRARRIAEATSTLTLQAAGFVDAQVSAFAHKIGHAALERLVSETTARFMPDQARANAEKAAEGRHITFHHDQVTFNCTTHLEGELDLADALDLDAALAAGAEQLNRVVRHVRATVAPTCRRHHRLKTHSAWTYTTLEPGSFL